MKDQDTEANDNLPEVQRIDIPQFELVFEYCAIHNVRFPAGSCCPYHNANEDLRDSSVTTELSKF